MVAVAVNTSPDFNANSNSVTVLPTNAVCNVPVVVPVPTTCVTDTPALFKKDNGPQ